MSEFVPRLLNKTVLLFPDLQDIDLIPFILNSRAVSAYDAVLLLEKSIKSNSSQDSLFACLQVSQTTCLYPMRLLYVCNTCISTCVYMYAPSM